jgi:protein regulator of cytokinesis 1
MNPYLNQAPPPPPLRQTSNSTTTTTVSGSENWETFDDASEDEVDASDIYYAKLRAAQGKRFAPDDGMDMIGKKSKGIRSVSPDGPHPGQVLRVAGSDTEWTDDFETY